MRELVKANTVFDWTKNNAEDFLSLIYKTKEPQFFMIGSSKNGYTISKERSSEGKNKMKEEKKQKHGTVQMGSTNITLQMNFFLQSQSPSHTHQSPCLDSKAREIHFLFSPIHKALLALDKNGLG